MSLTLVPNRDVVWLGCGWLLHLHEFTAAVGCICWDSAPAVQLAALIANALICDIQLQTSHMGKMTDVNVLMALTEGMFSRAEEYDRLYRRAKEIIKRLDIATYRCRCIAST
jgi:hypothetical protein